MLFSGVFAISTGSNSYQPVLGFDTFGEVSTYVLYLCVSLYSQWTSVLYTFNISKLRLLWFEKMTCYLQLLFNICIPEVSDEQMSEVKVGTVK